MRYKYSYACSSPEFGKQAAHLKVHVCRPVLASVLVAGGSRAAGETRSSVGMSAKEQISKGKLSVSLPRAAALPFT